VNGVCPGCSASAMSTCIRPHAGKAWPLALPAIPYMRANLRLKRRDLGAADVVVAVSHSVAADLRARGPELADSRIESIPNAVDVSGVRAAVRQLPPPLPVPYALFVGKLARNKGVSLLIETIKRAELRMPLVVIGDGPDRALLSDAAARANYDLRILNWLDRESVFQWMHYARLLIFPSGWPEPLSRVLIEASALGVPIAAMDTGGTSDIVVDEETGLLSRSVEKLAADVLRLADDGRLRERLGTAAWKRAESQFDVPVVIDRMERLYADAIGRFASRSS
jgi:glycosyltransferase involved in cell wall biosynthesis